MYYLRWVSVAQYCSTVVVIQGSPWKYFFLLLYHDVHYALYHDFFIIIQADLSG